jgi:DNA-binding MarR family transcriptional regulator
MQKDLIIQLHRHLHNIVNKHKTLDRISRNFGADESLNGGEIHTISAVGDCGMPTITKIATLLGVTKAAASQSIGNLCKNGYIRKMKDEKNKREVYLALTEKGQIAYASHQGLWNNQCLTYLSDLSDEQIRHFNEVAERIDQIVNSQLDAYK